MDGQDLWIAADDEGEVSDGGHPVSDPDRKLLVQVLCAPLENEMEEIELLNFSS